VVKLDLKDRKILYHLFNDSRQSFNQIGKKVGLHKDVVAYRVKKLLEKGIIKSYFTIINHQKFLGYAAYRCYIAYENISPEIKKEIIEYLVKCQYTTTINSLEGNYDLVFFLRAKFLPEIYKFWEIFLRKYRNYISKKVLSIYYNEVEYNLPFLLDEKNPDKSKK
jgi:DNA-binding Lrp family transcriptional regulator